jgi:hypothetical protein
MRSRWAGHGWQLLGHGLVFLGLAIVVAGLFVSGYFPGVPFWQFVVASMAIAVPLMLVGGRIDARGRGLVRNVEPATAAREYRQSVAVTAAYLGFLWILGLLAAAPVFGRAVGLEVSDAVFAAWLAVWVLVFCGGRPWVTRPLWRAIERRVTGKEAVEPDCPT